MCVRILAASLVSYQDPLGRKRYKAFDLCSTVCLIAFSKALVYMWVEILGMYVMLWCYFNGLMFLFITQGAEQSLPVDLVSQCKSQSCIHHFCSVWSTLEKINGQYYQHIASSTFSGRLDQCPSGCEQVQRSCCKFGASSLLTLAPHCTAFSLRSVDWLLEGRYGF